MNLYNKYISIYTDSDLDPATSNDADFNGNKFSKNPNSKLRLTQATFSLVRVMFPP